MFVMEDWFVKSKIHVFTRIMRFEFSQEIALGINVRIKNPIFSIAEMKRSTISEIVSFAQFWSFSD